MKFVRLFSISCAAILSSTPVWPATVLHTQVFQSGGTFTVPSAAKTSTIFEFTLVGGGGGGGGCGSSAGGTSGGGSGSAGVASLSGFNPLDTVTVTVGA